MMIRLFFKHGATSVVNLRQGHRRGSFTLVNDHHPWYIGRRRMADILPYVPPRVIHPPGSHRETPFWGCGRRTSRKFFFSSRFIRTFQNRKTLRFFSSSERSGLKALPILLSQVPVRIQSRIARMPGPARLLVPAEPAPLLPCHDFFGREGCGTRPSHSLPGAGPSP